MADDTELNKNTPPEGGDTGEKTVQVPLALLTQMQEQMAKLEMQVEESAGKQAGLEEMLAKDPSTTDEPKLRERKTYEPKFRTVRIRKYPRLGDHTNPGFVAGWSNRGAFQEVDRSGVSPVLVDYIEIMFLDENGEIERTEDGKLKAEKVRLLDYLNKGEQVNCKIVDKDVKPREVPTGEEIDVTTWDPQHGLVATGEKVDGYTLYSEIKYKLQIPGVQKEVWVDALYCNS